MRYGAGKSLESNVKKDDDDENATETCHEY